MFETIRNEQGEALDHTFHPGSGDRRDLVVIGHGVTANKDRPFLVALSEALSERGIASLRVSWSGNGRSGGRFEDSTITKEIADLGCVLDAVPGGWRVAYAGHSMGGAVGVGRASGDERIRALVSLAGMVRTKVFCERKFGDQRPGASLMWDKPECPLSQAYVDDLHGIDSLLQKASEITVPWLLVHGTDDSVVLPQDSRDASGAAADAELCELEGVDHVFSGDGTPRMVEVVAPWLERALGN